MLYPLSAQIPFAAHFTTSSAGATGLTVTVSVVRVNTDGTRTTVITQASNTAAVEVDSTNAKGLYSYWLAGASTGVAGVYLATFHTAGTADLKDVPSMEIVGAAWVETAADPWAAEEGQAVYTGVLAIGAGSISVSSPVTATGKVTLYSGYDHLGALRLTFTEPEGSTWPTSLVGAEVHLLAQTGHGTGAVTADIEGDVLVDTGDEKVIRFAPTATETEPLTATTTGKYDLYAIIDTDEVPLVVGGQLIVRDRIPE
jgi:hypothetical protein